MSQYRCLFCNQSISVSRNRKTYRFCSDEHQELYQKRQQETFFNQVLQIPVPGLQAACAEEPPASAAGTRLIGEEAQPAGTVQPLDSLVGPPGQDFLALMFCSEDQTYPGPSPAARMYVLFPVTLPVRSDSSLPRIELPAASEFPSGGPGQAANEVDFFRGALTQEPSTCFPAGLQFSRPRLPEPEPLAIPFEVSRIQPEEPVSAAKKILAAETILIPGMNQHATLFHQDSKDAMRVRAFSPVEISTATPLASAGTTAGLSPIFPSLPDYPRSHQIPPAAAVGLSASFCVVPFDSATTLSADPFTQTASRPYDLRLGSLPSMNPPPPRPSPIHMEPGSIGPAGPAATLPWQVAAMTAAIPPVIPVHPPFSEGTFPDRLSIWHAVLGCSFCDPSDTRQSVLASGSSIVFSQPEILGDPLSFSLQSTLATVDGGYSLENAPENTVHPTGIFPTWSRTPARFRQFRAFPPPAHWRSHPHFPSFLELLSEPLRFRSRASGFALSALSAARYLVTQPSIEVISEEQVPSCAELDWRTQSDFAPAWIRPLSAEMPRLATPPAATLPAPRTPLID